MPADTANPGGGTPGQGGPLPERTDIPRWRYSRARSGDRPDLPEEPGPACGRMEAGAAVGSA